MYAEKGERIYYRCANCGCKTNAGENELRARRHLCVVCHQTVKPFGDLAKAYSGGEILGTKAD